MARLLGRSLRSRSTFARAAAKRSVSNSRRRSASSRTACACCTCGRWLISATVRCGVTFASNDVAFSPASTASFTARFSAGARVSHSSLASVNTRSASRRSSTALTHAASPCSAVSRAAARSASIGSRPPMPRVTSRPQYCWPGSPIGWPGTLHSGVGRTFTDAGSRITYDNEPGSSMALTYGITSYPSASNSACRSGLVRIRWTSS